MGKPKWISILNLVCNLMEMMTTALWKKKKSTTFTLSVLSCEDAMFLWLRILFGLIFTDGLIGSVNAMPVILDKAAASFQKIAEETGWIELQKVESRR